MREWLQSILACPVCGSVLDLEVFDKSGDEIVDGILVCSCERWFPVIAGIPRIIWGEHREDFLEFLQKYGGKGRLRSSRDKAIASSTATQVKATFSTIWDRFPNFGINDKAKQVFYDRWMAQKLGLSSNEELYSFISTRNMILEVGIGSGQKLKMMAEHTNGKVVGIDLTASVEHTAKNTAGMQNLALVQADLFALPFKKGTFDFIISDGVLHHTPDTRRAFLSIAPFLTEGGEIAIRVYKRGTPIREFCDDHIRSFTTKMSQEECWQFCASMARLGEALARTKCEIEVPDDIELLGFKEGKYNLQRFIYYNMFKCFYNEAFSPDENILVNFDWYSPVDAHRHTDEEVRQWFAEAGLTDIKLFNPESGISARGKKP
jgi:SAM-dependent methyltransferase/uncharacterized protein YbaR (Trm112 family)